MVFIVSEEESKRTSCALSTLSSIATVSPALRDCKNSETIITALLAGSSANVGWPSFSETAGKQRSEKIYSQQVQQDMFGRSFAHLRPHTSAISHCQVSKWHHLQHGDLLQTGHVVISPFCWAPASRAANKPQLCQLCWSCWWAHRLSSSYHPPRQRIQPAGVTVIHAHACRSHRRQKVPE